MKTKGTFILTEGFGGDEGGSISVVVDIDYLRKTFTVKPSAYEYFPDFKFKYIDECFAMAELFNKIPLLIDDELSPTTS